MVAVVLFMIQLLFNSIFYTLNVFRSNPDGVAVTLACLQKDYVTSFEVREFDGVNWETFIALSDINKFSEG